MDATILSRQMHLVVESTHMLRSNYVVICVLFNLESRKGHHHGQGLSAYMLYTLHVIEDLVVACFMLDGIYIFLMLVPRKISWLSGSILQSWDP